MSRAEPAELSDSGPSLTARAQVAWLVVILLAGAALRVRLIDVPLERDEGEYGVIAQLILRGEVPYVAVYNMKLPGVFYAYALILAVLGDSAEALHWGLIPVTSASAALVFLLGRQWFDAATGLVAAAAFLLLTVTPELLGFTANAEHFLVPPMVAGWLCLDGAGEGRRGRAFAAGALFGLAILMKQHGIMFAAAAGTWLTVHRFRSSGWRGALRSAAAFALGVATPYLLMALYFIAFGGLAFERFWFWTVTYPRHYVSEITLKDGLGNLRNTLVPLIAGQWPILAMSVVGLTSLGWDPAARRRAGQTSALAIASALSVCPGWYFRQHYFLMAVPCAALFVGLGTSAVARLLTSRRSRSSAGKDGKRSGSQSRVVIALAMVCVVGSLWLKRSYFFSLGPMEICRMYFGNNPFPESLEVARYLSENTAPADTIAVIGSEPQIYFYTRLRPATRFIYTYPLMESHPFAKEMQHSMCREIDAANPKYLVGVTANSSWLRRPHSYSYVFNWLERTVRERYRLVGVIDIRMKDRRTEVYWGESVKNHEPTSGNLVLIYERNVPR